MPYLRQHQIILREEHLNIWHSMCARIGEKRHKIIIDIRAKCLPE